MYKVKRFSRPTKDEIRAWDNGAFNSAVDKAVKRINLNDKIGHTTVGLTGGILIGGSPVLVNKVPSGKIMLGTTAVGTGLGYLSGKRETKKTLGKSEKIKNKFKSADDKTREEMYDEFHRYPSDGKSLTEYKNKLTKWSKED